MRVPSRDAATWVMLQPGWFPAHLLQRYIGEQLRLEPTLFLQPFPVWLPVLLLEREASWVGGTVLTRSVSTRSVWAQTREGCGKCTCSCHSHLHQPSGVIRLGYGTALCTASPGGRLGWNSPLHYSARVRLGWRSCLHYLAGEAACMDSPGQVRSPSLPPAPACFRFIRKSAEFWLKSTSECRDSTIVALKQGRHPIQKNCWRGALTRTRLRTPDLQLGFQMYWTPAVSSQDCRQLTDVKNEVAGLQNERSLEHVALYFCYPATN